MSSAAARRRTVKPPPPTEEEDRVLDQRLANLERSQQQLQAQLARLLSVLEPMADPKPVPAQPVPVVEEPTVPQEIREALRRMPEPRRQRKERNLAPRKTYRLKRTLSALTLRELQNLTPAASSIVVYLATHPGATLPDISVQLDLRRKTVGNLLSVLRGKDLLDE